MFDPGSSLWQQGDKERTDTRTGNHQDQVSSAHCGGVHLLCTAWNLQAFLTYSVEGGARESRWEDVSTVRGRLHREQSQASHREEEAAELASANTVAQAHTSLHTVLTSHSDPHPQPPPGRLWDSSDPRLGLRLWHSCAWVRHHTFTWDTIHS